MRTSIILNTDSYKASHFKQYPSGAEQVSSYIEARHGEELSPYTVFAGAQYFFKEVLSKPISADDIAEAKEIFTGHGVPFNEPGWRHILNAHGGFLPLDIQALPEGTVTPRGTALMQVANTDPAVPWLTSYIETALLRAVWYPTTVATVSWRARGIIKRFLDDTCDDPEGQIAFKFHDFGARGVSSLESAGIGGVAHLMNFRGTDNVEALLVARRFYHCAMAGFSIPAAEHSTITAWGREHEAEAYENMLDQFGQGALVAVVSDSYDLNHAVSNLWGGTLKDKVLAMTATLVIRPDSGNPQHIVLETLRRLMAGFGYAQNSKGYAVLHPKVRVIQGDGVNLASIAEILQVLKDNKISAENVAFGMGGGLLQQINRDTLRFAMKANAIKVNGQWRDVSKDPITDPAKRSKAGRLGVVHEGGAWQTLRVEDIVVQGLDDRLHTVWRDGHLLRDDTLDEIRDRVRASSAVF